MWSHPAARSAADETAAQTQAPTFLRLTEGQRSWWFEGAFRATAHLVGMHDKAKRDCVVKWYLEDRDAKRKLIEETMAKYRDKGETTIILGLVPKAIR